MSACYWRWRPHQNCGWRTVALAVLLGACFPVALPAGSEPGLAEPPHWPYGFTLPKNVPLAKKPPKKTPILAWTPPRAKRIRAVLLIVENTDSKHFGEHAATRKVAAKHEMGIVYLRGVSPEGELGKDAKSRVVFNLLDAIAEQTGIVEFRHAPWITFGKSSRGKFPFYLAWAYPERMIATISYHAETPTWPPEDWARFGGETILNVCLNGETEWGGTWNRHVRPSLLNYRARSSWLPHQAVGYDVGHGNYLDVHGGAGWGKPFPGKVTCIRVWDYLALFLDKALEARLPKGAYPTNAPVALKQIDENTGYLIRPYAVEDMFKMPRIPLVKVDGNYVVDPGGGETRATFAAIPPARNYAPPVDAPLADLTFDDGPSKWLITEGLEFAMERDPMRELGELATLRPKPGDKVTIDGRETTFRPIDAKYVRRSGGIALNNGLQKQAKMTLLAYTVLNVQQKRQVKLKAPFTQSGRVQVALNGVPVAHGQILELEPGLHPMLVAVRLRTKWSSLKTGFAAATAEEVKNAKAYTAELARKQAQGGNAPGDPETPTDAPVIRRAADVPAPERKNMFWVADRELAEAWFKLHAVRGQVFESKE